MRSGFASLAVAAALVAGCLPDAPRLPPRRTAFHAQPAQPIQPPPDLPRETEAPIVHERYGLLVFAADLLSIAPLTYWMAKPRDAYLAAPALVLAPAIHVAYGEPDRAAASVLLRSLMVVGVYFAGRSVRSECEGQFVCYPIGSILLAELAIIPVMTLDAVLLARRARPDRSWLRLPVRPVLAPNPGGASLGIGGSF